MLERRDTEPSDPKYRAPALDRGLDILEVLAGQADGLTRTELMRELGLGASQIYRMLERLVARGYVTRLAGGDRYALSMKLFLLATGHPPVRRLTAQAQPEMDRFAREMNQSCHLVMPEHGAGIVVAQASPASHWEFRARVGASMDLFHTGSGITLLAFQRPDQIGATMGHWGLQDAAERLAQCASDLAAIRAAGYRAEPSRQVVGITDLSVPVLGPSGEAVAAITCAYLERPGHEETPTRAATLARLIALGRTLSLDAAPG